jgi:phenylpropionate dioxygenase-like ring-hydroxylating dioxygenase large terminal subunit
MTPGDDRNRVGQSRHHAGNTEDLMNVRDTSLLEALDRGRTLPAEWYTDPEMLARERKRIFATSWNYVGRVEQVAKAGDFLTVRVGEVPVFIVRDEAGTLKAFANVCGHRGSELVLEPCGNRRTLQCHYHAWTWGLDGTLRAAPRSQEQAGFDKADFPLTPLGIETFGPFLFINPGPASFSFAATLGQLPAILRSSGVDIDALTFRERREYPIQANWKVVVENFLECYHCAISHPGLAGLIDLDEYRVVPYERFSVQRGPLKAGARARREDGFGSDEGREGIYTYLWPNFMLNAYPGPGNASTNLILPIDENHCLAVYEFFFSDRMPEEEQRAMVDFIDQVQREDIIIVESVQRGLRSGFYKQGQLILSRENGIQHFQKLVFSALTDTL